MPPRLDNTGANNKAEGPHSFRKFLLLWPMFFLICCGLGYSALRRYDPRDIEGLTDTYKYYGLTVNSYDQNDFKWPFRERVLVPYVAKPFAWFAARYVKSVNAGFFGLLMANALFCATTACLIVSIGYRVIGNFPTALLGATLYLLNFDIANLQLAGLIDAGESFFMAATVWSLLFDKWFLLPLWGLLGALAKESFVPLSSVFVFTWWLIEGRRRGTSWTRLKWVVALILVALATEIALQSILFGRLMGPWQIAAEPEKEATLLSGVRRLATERSFGYIFVWLIPLGVWRLKSFPSSWLISSALTSALAIVLAALVAGGTFSRALFDIVGPLLSLSVAALLTDTNAFLSGRRLRT